MNDTPKEIAELVREKLLSLSGYERMLMSARSFEAARAMILASFPPGLSDFETKVRLCERLYGNEINVKAFARTLLSKQEKMVEEAIESLRSQQAEIARNAVQSLRELQRETVDAFIESLHSDQEESKKGEN